MIPAAEVFVTVLGEVNRPGVIPFQYGLTVSDYLLRAGGPTREADLGLVHFVDKTGRILRHAPLDAPVATGDILIVERQVILRLLEGIQRIAPIISLFNNTATAVNTVRTWIDPAEQTDAPGMPSVAIISGSVPPTSRFSRTEARCPWS